MSTACHLASDVAGLGPGTIECGPERGEQVNSRSMSDEPASSRSRRTEIDFDLIRPAKAIVGGSLGLLSGERFVLLIDRERAALGDALAEAARSLGARPTAFVLEDIATRPVTSVPEALQRALEAADVSILLIGVEHRDEVAFRTAFVRIVEDAKLRHAHVIGLSRRSFVSSFNVEPARIGEMAHAVHMRVLGQKQLHYRTPSGTNLEIALGDGRWFERSGHIAPGKWANLPAGEVIALPESVDGVFVADASSNIALAGLSDLRSEPITFTIERGVVAKVDAKNRALASAVREHLESEEKLDHVGHIVLGANPGLTGSIGEMVHDQCVPGLHVVFGWTNQKVTKAPWTTTNILAVNGAPGDLDVGGKPLLRGGRYML
jgi:leucyl aminopeptidase (aminopeptidase T)